MPQLTLLAGAAATFYMTGLIWFVQVVHYPLFGAVGPQAWVAYGDAHRRLTTLVVGPPMLLELATAALLAWRPPPAAGRALPLAGLALVVVAWASTALLQVPMHDRLTGTFDPQAHRALVLGNWVRTAAWTARAAVVLVILARVLRTAPA